MTDFRDAFRALRATPVVTAVAILSLAFGIGANTAIFSIVNALMLRVLPVQEPRQLVQVLTGPQRTSFSNPLWEALRERQDQVFAGAFGYSSPRFNLARAGELKPVYGIMASGRFFEVLGVPAILLWWLAGGLSGVFLVGFLVVAILLGVLLSLAALTLEEHSFRRHREGREIARLIGFSFVENVGYRQIVAFWRFLGFFDLVRGRRDWGEMRRKGFSTMPEAPLPPV